MGKKKLGLLVKKKINKNINSAISWLVQSGIQNVNYERTKDYGAFNAWYDTKSKKYSYLYSEITGYLITFMIYNYKITKKKKYLKSAELSADWLINNAQHSEGGFKCLFLINKKLEYKKKENQVYSFDNGVIINGLINLYKVTKKKKYLISAKKSANFIISRLITKNFKLRPVYDLGKKKFIRDQNQWSLVPGAYHSKVSMGLLNLYSTTQISKYLKFSKKILNIYLNSQKKNGEFKSTKHSTNFHPYCYSLEGYWACGKYLKNKKYIDSSLLGTKWLIEIININGLPPRIKYKDKLNYFERVDILSQTLRLIIIHLNSIKIDKILSYKVNRLIKNIISNQYLNNKSIKIRGGFSWGKKSNGEDTKNVNSWVTAFALQSLYILSDKRALRILNKNPFYLV